MTAIAVTVCIAALIYTFFNLDPPRPNAAAFA